MIEFPWLEGYMKYDHAAIVEVARLGQQGKAMLPCSFALFVSIKAIAAKSTRYQELAASVHPRNP